MVKLNRIGNKLGLAGLAGILLSIGMVANQTTTESSVSDANGRADVQQQLDHRLDVAVSIYEDGSS